MNNKEKDRLWYHYLQNLTEGLQYSLEDLGVWVRDATEAQSKKEVQDHIERPIISRNSRSGNRNASRKKRGKTENQVSVEHNLEPYFAIQNRMKEVAAYIRGKELIDVWNSLFGDTDLSPRDEKMTDERKIVELGLEFLDAADKVRAKHFYNLLIAGVPVNFQHPKYLETAIHITCSRNAANAFTELLLDHPETDLLLRDQFGRQAWNNAELFGIDTDLAGRVLSDTLKQVKQKRISLETFQQEYQEHLSIWINQEWYYHLARRAQYTREP
jgi:hypothetical protein